MAYVTDHAVLRFLQRHHGVDVEGIRQALTVGAIDKAAAFGCGSLKMNGGHLRLTGDVASTYIEKPKKRHPPRYREAEE